MSLKRAKTATKQAQNGWHGNCFKIGVSESGPAQHREEKSNEDMNNVAFISPVPKGSRLIRGGSRAAKRYEPKLASDLVLDQEGFWRPVGYSDGVFQPHTFYARPRLNDRQWLAESESAPLALARADRPRSIPRIAPPWYQVPARREAVAA